MRRRKFEATAKRWKLIIAIGWLATLCAAVAAGGAAGLGDVEAFESVAPWLGGAIAILCVGKTGAWWFHG